MKKKLLIFLFLYSLSITAVFAQRTVTGKVTGSDDGLPLPGVSIKVAGGSGGTQTNAQGDYTINLPAGSSALIFTYVGFTTTTVPVGSQSVLNVKLTSDSKALTEVVVTGYGLQQRKRDLTGANSVVSGKDIANVPVQSFDNALNGRAAGVQVTSASGIPGANVSVNIRGVNSINAGTQPLYIIDGVEVVAGDQTRNFPTSNALAGINPNDIESINIMKDAAAAAIYGAQAANGVVIVTTKRGKAGRTQIDFRAYGGYSEVVRKQELLNTPEFIQLSREAIINRYGSIALALRPANQGGNPDVVNLLNSFGDPVSAPTYDWQDAVFRKGGAQNYDLSASGGNENTKFFVSGSYNKQIGQTIGQDFSRGSVRVNLDQKVSEKISFGSTINLAAYTQNGTPGGTGFASPNRSAMLIPPYVPIYRTDGTFNTPIPGAYTNNVVQTTAFDVYQARTKKLTGNFNVNYQIVKDLRFRSSYSIDYTNIAEDRFQDPRTPDGSQVNGRAAVYNTFITDFNTDQTLNYNHSFGGHKLGVIAGVTYKTEGNEGNSATGTGFPTYQLRTLNSAATPSAVAAFYTGYKRIGYFSRVDYSYNDKYIASATVRHEGSSRFGVNNRYGTFPAGSIGWRINKESFLENVNWIDDLKLRASYGVLGNSAIGDFDALSQFTSNGGGSYAGGAGLTPVLGNDNLTWEQSQTTDVGVDFSFFKGRLSGGVGAFIKNTSKLLLNRSLPVNGGFATYRDNIGKLRNEGLEIELNTTNIAGKFQWTTTATATFLKSKLLELNDGLQTLSNTYFVGEPLLTFNTYRYAGVNPADGNAMFYDRNGNITYNPTTDDRVKIGSQLPKGYGGLTNTFTYKGISLSAFIQYQYGNKINNVDAQFLRRMGSTLDRNQDRSELRRWQKPGDITDTPRPYYNTGAPTGNQNGGITYTSVYSLVNSHMIEDGSYVRLKTLSLSYNLPVKLLQGTFIRNVQVYGQAYNLVTLTKFTGTDPEVQAASYSGIVPQYRTITFGVQVGL
ncbi:TonB-dependent receptor [Mucilaginibacter sp. PAMB04168]|uniref:SusC/RagA family TonB-linked outer membrane protein n=1 Tax=Mucilaginibacter sp. PAMB04168 TaxID=3138567 RepID=UPI0031F64726